MEKRLEELGFCPDSFANDIQDHKSDCDGNPSVYVGAYGKYNDGSLCGLRLDLTTFHECEDLVNFCKAIHAAAVNVCVSCFDLNVFIND